MTVADAWRSGLRWKRPLKRGRYRRWLTPSAQHLPSHIVQHIAYYVSAADDYYRDSGGRSRSSDDRLSRASQALVGVCRSWRVALLTMFYRHFVLDINCTAMWISPYRKMVNTSCPEINSNIKHLARSVHITAPFAGVFNGKVLHILDVNGYSGAVFPEIKGVWLNLYAGTTVPIEEIHDVDTYIQQFSTYIAALFPNSTHYHFQVSLFTDSDDSFMVGKLLMALVTSRCERPLHTVEYVHASSGVRIGGLNVLGLTHITIQDGVDSADCVNLVRRNAETLVAADLAIIDAVDYVPQLSADDDGNLIIYPRLQRLSVHSRLLPEDTTVAFPALKHLRRTSRTLFIANVDSRPEDTVENFDQPLQHAST
ncbi:hypothetical protein COEREDRAFT_79001 [Coemansia reversa NRRL 1564]|uniref:Uncharacterized protein n=1 Tax=Coemansia reversa (strain ATCC 12441 / NRRL 1564) TaxID=763665 RepID=A0A2G5BL33_COERN|nr:hypothetical protein COEREDRAFT_79001 [Coemansia reversa NRRL 1564]|eukprot:PIA19710.1 hypothetical protein COEREDRAFT_79001 [Coemansia reversa NRRL 1564]